MSEEYMQGDVLFNFPLEKFRAALLIYSLSCQNTISVGVMFGETLPNYFLEK